MDKIYSAARAIAVIYAIIGAFTALPESALVLLVLGGISALGNASDDNQRVLITAIALNICAPLLVSIPTIGQQLATIFGGFGMAYAGAAIVGIALALVARVRSDWA
jgi:hypothetical protein